VTEGTVGVDPGLLERFRRAGAEIAWRSAPRAPGRAGAAGARIAHLHDEECRVERRGSARTPTVTVDSGPVGALVLLLEFDRRGPPRALGAGNAGRDPAFPGGALVATWGTRPVARDTAPTVRDLVELARYALA
jgi:hypothetical protein